MVRFECKKCGSLLLSASGIKTVTCNICGTKQSVPLDAIEDKPPTTNNDYDPQWKHYEKLLYKAQKYRDIKILTETAEEFDRLGDYKDSRKMADYCRDRIAEEQIRKSNELEQDKIKNQRKDKARKIDHGRMALLNIGVVVLAIVITIIGNWFLNNKSYLKVTSYISNGRYEDALTILKKMNGYKDTEKWIDKCEAEINESNYNNAVTSMERGYYVSAQHQFEDLNGYKDSDALALECRYRNALRFISVGNYETALVELTALGDYKDCKDQILVCEAALRELEAQMIEARYNNAIENMNQGRYANAQSVFISLKGYKDSDTLALECQYQKALQLMEEESYERALEEFEAIGDYKDAPEQADIARLKLASNS